MASLFICSLFLSLCASGWCQAVLPPPQTERNFCHALPWLHKCEPNGYDRMTAPQMAFDGKTTPVQIQIYIESVGNFKSATMDYDMDVYLIQHWQDPRLRHNQSVPLSLHSRAHLDRLWVPDVYFSNSKKADFNFVTVPNYILLIHSDGHIRYSMRISLKVSCHMVLHAYPIDRQRCYLKIATYGTTTDKVNVTWTANDTPIHVNPELTGADLKVLNIVPTYCNGSYFGLEFSCLMATIYLKRDFAFSLLQTFIPSTVIVCISWISFWIDPASVPGRVSLALTTLLTLSTQAIGLHYQLPPVGYATAQDVWLGVCVLFLFGALIEFALVNMYTRQGEALAVQAKAAGTSKDSPTDPASPSDTQRLLGGLAKDCKRKAAKIDAISRIAFPIAFFTFCILYWCIYSLVVGKKIN